AELVRSQTLAQPADLPGTLLDWLDIDRSPLAGGHAASLLPVIRGETESVRQFAYILSQHERAVRTPAWLLRIPTTGAPELYAKRRARWEVNGASKLCTEVAAGLQAALEELETTGGKIEWAAADEMFIRPLA